MRYAVVTTAAVALAAAAFFVVRLSATTSPPRQLPVAGSPVTPAATKQMTALILETQRRPDYAPAHLQLGEFLLKSGGVRNARKSFERALELSPASVRALYGIAACCEKEADHAGALKAYLRIAELRPDEPGLKDRIRAAQAAISTAPKAR